MYKVFHFLSWVLLSSILVGCQPSQPPQTHALLYETARPINPFLLQDQNEKTVTEKALKGKWTLLFLGYTSCPDICPMTLSKLTQVHKKFNNELLTVWFISVDPKRDTAEKRQLYIDYFNRDFKAVSAEHKSLFPFVRNLGLVYAIHDEGNGENYTVDHSASVTLVDPNGQVRAIFKPEFERGQVPLIDSEKMLDDLHKIIAYY